MSFSLRMIRCRLSGFSTRRPISPIFYLYRTREQVSTKAIRLNRLVDACASHVLGHFSVHYFKWTIAYYSHDCLHSKFHFHLQHSKTCSFYSIQDPRVRALFTPQQVIDMAKYQRGKRQPWTPRFFEEAAQIFADPRNAHMGKCQSVFSRECNCKRQSQLIL